MTELRLRRMPSANAVTFGTLYVNGIWQCYTLEDQLREVPGRPVAEWKVPKRTAIPEGRYRVRLTESPKFGIVTPEILDVPGYVGIRIHWGTDADDTEGCPIVGRRRDLATLARVLESRLAFKALMARLTNAGDLFIAVENPPGYTAAA